MTALRIGFQCKAIFILLFVTISRNRVQCKLEEVKASKDKNLVDMAYILKPSESAIDVACHSKTETSLKITCPVFDNENSSFDITTNYDACKSTMYNKSSRNVCSAVIHRFSWSPIKNITSFFCFCWARQETQIIFERKAFVKISNHAKKRRKTTVFRRKIEKGKHIHLTCGITGHPRPKITWYKNYHSLRTNDRTIINNARYRQKGRSLLISRSDIGSSGDYQCVAQNLVGEAKGDRYRVEIYVTKPMLINRRVQLSDSNGYSFQEFMGRKKKKPENEVAAPTNQQQTKSDGPYFKQLITMAYETNDDIENDENEGNNGLGTVKMVGMIAGTVVFVALVVIVLIILRRFSTKCQCRPNLLTETRISTPPPTECTNDYEQNTRTTCLYVDTTNEESVNDYPKQDSPSQDSTTYSFTSALLNEMNMIPPNADARYFTSRLVDHHGGEVILPDTGIRLIIPEGAIDVGKTEAISLALPEKSDFIPAEIINDGTLLTPVVMCGPHGLHFKKYVLLILPHCTVVDDELEENFRVYCSDTKPGIAPDWKEIFNTTMEQSKDVFCNMGKQHFSLFIQHFSWYFIEGEGNAKNFSVAAYHTSFHQPDEDFKVRIYFIPNMEGSSVSDRKVQRNENSLKGTLGDGLKLKIFHQDAGDLKVEAIKINDGWKLPGGKTQMESYKQLCCCQDGSPNRTFNFKHKKNRRPDSIFCMFRISQEKCEFDIPVEISVSEHFQSAIKRAQMRGSLTSESSSGLGSGESGAKLVIPTRLRKDLIQLLDVEIAGKEDYRMLASRLGYKNQFIRWLGCQNRQSPTEGLLMEWENDHPYQSQEHALRKLHGILVEMRREDAAEKIHFELKANGEADPPAFDWV